MQRFHPIGGAGRGRGLARLGATLLAAASLAGAAAASQPESGVPETGLEERRVVCTPFGCRALPRASWTWVVAFGTACVAAGWIGRRVRSTRARSA